MSTIDLTAFGAMRLISIVMADQTSHPSDPSAQSDSSPSPLDPFTVDEIARIVALSRFSRKAVKDRLHIKGVPSNATAVDAFLAAVPRHRHNKRIMELASEIETAKRAATRPSDQSGD